MDRVSTKIARICIGLAIAIFFAETLFGCFAVLGVGIASVNDVLLDLSLTMALPIALIMIRSRQIATVCLWLFFAFQWAEMCLVTRPPVLLNPFDGFHDDALFLGIALFTLGDITLYRAERRNSTLETNEVSDREDLMP
jgi:hypothetical protein